MRKACKDILEPHGRLPTLPRAIGNVTAPPLFSPSRFASLIQCPLKEIHGLPEEDMLPPSPLAILGGVIHEVMKEARVDRTQYEPSATESVENLLERKIRLMEKRLSEDPQTKRLVPLRRAVGKTEYRNRKALLRSWAKTLCGEDRERCLATSSKGSGTRGRHDAELAETTRIPVGAEQSIRVSSLRLSGRPDLIELDEDGTHHITDFKTGNLLDRAGKPKEDYALQMRLYALMLQEIDESARVRLWLEGSARVEIPWNEGHAEETLEQLLSVIKQLPTGRVLSANSFARTGTQCGSCRIRHRCSRYRNVAPVWWTEKSSRVKVAPFDIWGDVQAVAAEGEGPVEMLLLDAAGRQVRVAGICAQDVRLGDRVWFFDLQPTQRLPHHGLFVHPQNLHGKRPNPAWRNAVRYSGFVENQGAVMSNDI
jgi:RecB family exonuclease